MLIGRAPVCCLSRRLAAMQTSASNCGPSPSNYWPSPRSRSLPRTRGWNQELTDRSELMRQHPPPLSAQPFAQILASDSADAGTDGFNRAASGAGRRASSTSSRSSTLASSSSTPIQRARMSRLNAAGHVHREWSRVGCGGERASGGTRPAVGACTLPSDAAVPGNPPVRGSSNTLLERTIRTEE